MKTSRENRGPVFFAIVCGTLILISVGCRKPEAPKAEPAPKVPGVSIESQSTPTAPDPASATPPPAPAEAPSDAPAEGQANSSEEKVIADVQYAYLAYCREHTAPPADLSVLVSSHYLQSIPVLPSGKRFVLDNKNYKVLVNR